MLSATTISAFLRISGSSHLGKVLQDLQFLSTLFEKKEKKGHATFS